MSEIPVVPTPQNPVAGVPTPSNGGMPPAPTLTPDEIADLKRRADASSQNFERLKKANDDLKAAQGTIAQLQTQLASSGGDHSDEGKILLSQINELKGIVSTLTTELGGMKAGRDVEALKLKYPVLVDKWAEFQEWYALDENKELPLQTAAKAFVTEKDLLVPAPARKGLEQPTGGRGAPSTGEMTAEDARLLRENNYEEYRKLLLAGKLIIKA